MPTPHPRPRRIASCGAVLGVVAALTLTAVPPTAAAPPSPPEPARPGTSAGPPRARPGELDLRTVSVEDARRTERQLSAKRRTASRALASTLGRQGVLQLDPATGTPAAVSRQDGFLTGRSTAGAATITLRYLRRHRAAFGLSEADLATLVLRRRYVDIAGIQHLSWVQASGGIPVFGQGLRAEVTRRGELIAISGSPVAGLSRLAARAEATPELTAAQARRRAATDVGGQPAPATTTAGSPRPGEPVRWSNADRAQLVWFVVDGGLRLGWSTYVQAGGDTLNFAHVLDARSGAVLYRHDAVDRDRPPAPGRTSSARVLVYDNYPGAAVGGRQRVTDLVGRRLLAADATTFSGPYVRAFVDADADDQPDAGVPVPVPVTGSATSRAQYRLVPYDSRNPLCSLRTRCTWDPQRSGSWRVNAAADVTQGFYFTSIFHQYLQASPFGFTRVAGSFEARDGDALQLHSLDGASTGADDMPDDRHVDNANMTTPPDGIAPTMRMYLFHAPGATNTEDPSLPTSSSFDPGVVLHEYVHGLSNRLVVDADGNSTLRSFQAGSMGEGWSDYFAADYLDNARLEPDTAASGELGFAEYLGAGRSLLRTMPVDCPVTSTSSRCAAPDGERGGYTYGQLSDVVGYAEVHAAGEVWSQTLWDLRRRLGHTTTGMLVTRAMELSPADPSYITMRNAILQADLAVYGGRNRAAIWSVFAARGLGFYASTEGSSDPRPVEDFSLPPVA